MQIEFTLKTLVICVKMPCILHGITAQSQSESEVK